MTNEQKPCAATTKSGAPCKNKAQANSDYCYVHRALAAKAVPAKAKPAKTKSTKAATTKAISEPKSEVAHTTQFQEVIAELDSLVNEIRAQLPDYTPPPFSPHALVAMLKENLHHFTPEIQLDLVNQLKSNLEGTRQELIDPETWKGMWYILNYSLQSQSSTLKEQLAHRLSTLPGVTWLSDLKGNLEDASPKDLLDVETWKGAWHIVNHSLKAQAGEMKRKLMGKDEPA